MASYGLLEDLLLRAGSVGAMEVRGQLDCLPFRSITASAVDNSVASLSRYPLPIVSSFIGTASSENAVQTEEIQQNFVGGKVVGSGSAYVPSPAHWVKNICHQLLYRGFPYEVKK